MIRWDFIVSAKGLNSARTDSIALVQPPGFIPFIFTFPCLRGTDPSYFSNY